MRSLLLWFAGFVSGAALVIRLHRLADRASAARYARRDAVLRHLVTAGEWVYGFDLAKRAGVSRGDIYVLLMELEDDGLVSSLIEQPAPVGRLARRQYAATELGRAFLLRLDACAP